jgi:D-arabinose 1-dehydrogenase-like Zn-dependent alcohol dehydrogenase
MRSPELLMLSAQPLPDGRKDSGSASVGTAATAATAILAGAAILLPVKSRFKCNSGARPGDLVAILGIGGLGHLGVQFAAKMGFRTVAIARGMDKEPLARKLGAWSYIDSKTQDPAAELLKLGGAKVVLATVTSGDAMSATLGGLGINGKLVILGAAAEPLQVPGIPLLLGRRSILGWPSGSSIDSQDTLAFSKLTGVRAMTEIFPLERAAEAYEHMMSGRARFRAVLTMGH